MSTLCDVIVTLTDRFAAITEDPAARRALEQEITRSLERLCLQLSLPYSAFEVIAAGGLDPNSATQMQVSVNGVACRLPQFPQKETGTTVEDLTRALMHAVHAERHLLLGPELSAQLRSRLPRSGVLARPDLTAQTYHELVCLLLRRGFSSSHAINLAHHESPSRFDPEVLYDLATDWTDTKLELVLPAAAEEGAAPAAGLGEMLKLMHDGLFYELGIVLPTTSVRIDDQLKAGQFRIQLNDVELPVIRGLEPDEFLVNDTVGALSLLEVEAREATNPANGNKAAIVKREGTAHETCVKAGLTTWGPLEYIILYLSSVVRTNASTFLTDEIVQRHLDVLRSPFPYLVSAARQRFDVITLTHILRCLLEEETSIRDLRGVLEALLALNATTDANLTDNIVFASTVTGIPFGTTAGLNHLTVGDYADAVRVAMRRYLSHKHTRGQSTLIVYLLDREIEARLARVADEPLTPDERSRLIAAFASELARLRDAPIPAVLTGSETRRHIRTVLEREFPSLPVLSYFDLSPEMNISPLARITW